MLVNGLVITLDDESRADEVVIALRAAGPFTPGERFGTRLSVALETASEADSEHWHTWLHGLPGVLKVDVAFVYFDEAADETRRNQA